MSMARLSPLDQEFSLVGVKARERTSAFTVEATYDRAAVETAWIELEPAGSAFQSRRWLTHWFEILAPAVRARPLFITVRDRASGRPLILFAFCVRRRWGFTVAEFPDLGVTDYNSPLCAADLALDDEQLKALWTTIRKAAPDVDVFLFEKIPAALYGRPVPLARLAWLKPIETRCWTVKLPASREEYEATLLRSKDRKEQRRKRRNLAERLGEAVLVVAGSRQQADEFFETLKSMRAERFKGRNDLLREQKFAPFYQAVASDWKDFASVATVQAGNKMIAALLALRHENNYVLIMHSFAADIKELSPGIVALDELISYLIGAKMDHCDFTIGNESYKRQFGVMESMMLQGVDAVTPRGMIFYVIINLYRKLRHQFGNVFRKYARSLLAEELSKRIRTRQPGFVKQH